MLNVDSIDFENIMLIGGKLDYNTQNKTWNLNI